MKIPADCDIRGPVLRRFEPSQRPHRMDSDLTNRRNHPEVRLWRRVSKPLLSVTADHQRRWEAAILGATLSPVGSTRLGLPDSAVRPHILYGRI